MVLINGYISYTGQRYCNVFPVGMHTQTNRFWPVSICNKLSGEKQTFSHKKVLLQLAGGSYFPICHGLQKYGLLLLISLHLAENITSANFLNKKTNTAGLWIDIVLDHYLNTVRESMFLRWIIATLLICEEDISMLTHLKRFHAFVQCYFTWKMYIVLERERALLSTDQHLPVLMDEVIKCEAGLTHLRYYTLFTW